jgi:hypothetical protein
MQPGYPGYGTPPGYGYGYGMPQAPMKSTTPKTLGTLSMVFGGIVAAMNLIGLAAGKQLGSMMQVRPGQEEAFQRYLSEVHGASMALGVVMFLMSAVLFVIGTGQRSYKRWAVKASIVWGILALVVLFADLIVQFTVMMPALDRFIEAISHGNGVAAPVSGIMKISAILGLAFYAPFPIILIAAFRKPVNVQAMDQPPQETPAANVF